jgi:hypothetical protein
MSETQFPMEPFLGAWELDAAHAQYQVGAPPPRGTYQIVREGDTYAFVMDWTDAAGQDFHMVYYSVPDGIAHSFEGSAAVDAILTRVPDAHVLETLSLKNGETVAHAQRVLSPDGLVMTITQMGKLPDGTIFANVAPYYKRP